MRLATLNNGQRDGQLVVVSADANRCLPVPDAAPTLQAALDDWERARPLLQAAADRLHADPGAGQALDMASLLAPLPRAYQWVDASGYLSHMERVRKARGADMPPSARTEPVIYQGLSDRNLAWCEDIPADPAWGADLEGELAVITGDLGPAPTPEEALAQVRLLVLVNDVSLRSLIPGELAKGFGFFHSKPASAFGPFAVTPDELGAGWREGACFRPAAALRVNGTAAGRPAHRRGPGLQLCRHHLLRGAYAPPGRRQHCGRGHRVQPRCVARRGLHRGAAHAAAAGRAGHPTHWPPTWQPGDTVSLGVQHR